MTASANGWPTLTKDETKQWRIPGFTQTTIPLRKGAVGFVLIHFASWFHDELERLWTGYDDWGWSPRYIAGTSTPSNHWSGTALDLNSEQHSWAQSGTFAPAQEERLVGRLDRAYPVLEWGGSWSRPDEMHFEICTPYDEREAVDILARALRKTERGMRVIEDNR